MNTEMFISAISTRPVIWRNYHPHQKFKNVTRYAWFEIQQLFPDYSIEQLKKRWKNLKDSYRRELKKLPISKSGAIECESTVKWKYFAPLGFLKGEMFPNCSGTNPLCQDDISDQELDSDAEADSLSKIDCILFTPDESPATSLPTPPCDEFPSSTQSAEIKLEHPIPTTEAVPRSSKRKSPDDFSVESFEIQKKMIRMLEMELMGYKNQLDQKSDDYHFLMSILPQMEKLPDLQKMRVRNKINQAIIEEMEKTFEMKS